MPSSLPSAAVPLLAGSAIASVGLFSSLALQVALGRLDAPELGLNAATRVRIFALSSKFAAPTVLGTGFLCTTLSLFSIFAYPNPNSKTPLSIAAISFLAVAPYTLYTLVDRTKELSRINRGISTGSDGELSISAERGRRAEELMRSWTYWAGWRTGIVAVGWTALGFGLGKELGML